MPGSDFRIAVTGSSGDTAPYLVDSGQHAVRASVARGAAVNCSGPPESFWSGPETTFSAGPEGPGTLFARIAAESLVLPAGLLGAPLSSVAVIDTTVRAILESYGGARIDRLFPDVPLGSVDIVVDGETRRVPPLHEIWSIVVSDSVGTSCAIASLDSLDCVGFAELGSEVVLHRTPNDSLFWIDQWSLRNSGQNGGVPGIDTDATTAWDETVGSPDIVVAVVDRGIDRDHPDFVERVVVGDNEGAAEDYHGTSVASVIGAKTHNYLYMAGVDWNCTLMDKKTLGTFPSTFATQVVEAVDGGASVINMSYGWHTLSESLKHAIEYANANNVFVTASSGNENSSLRNIPAVFPDVVAAGGIDRRGLRWVNSPDVGANFGPWISVVGPASEVAVLTRSGFGYGQGTSYAAPFVAGVGSLALAVDQGSRPQWHPTDMKKAIERTATDLLTPGFDEETGWGLANAGALCEYLTSHFVFHDQAVSMQVLDVGPWEDVYLDEPGTWPVDVPSGTYSVQKYTLYGGNNYFDIGHPIDYWIRHEGTEGTLHPGDYYYSGQSDGEFLEVAQDLVVVSTAVYKVRYGPGDNFETWLPCPPDAATVAYTLLYSVEPLADLESTATVRDMQFFASAVRGDLGVWLSSPLDQSAEFVVYDVSGREMYRESRPVLQGVNRVVFDVGRRSRQWSSGVYFVRCAGSVVGRTNAKVVLAP